jgi:hypothetical protein
VPNIDTALVDAKRRATGYQDIDGLTFLAWSAFALLLGCISLWLHRINADLAILATSVVLISWFFVGHPDAPVMLWLKSRITYPRTGFVALPQPGSTESAALEVDKRHKLLRGATIVASVAAAVLSSYASNSWISLVIFTAGIVAVCLAYWDDARMRILWLIIPSFWLSAWIASRMQLSRAQETPYVFFAFAILSFIVGTMRLLSYLMRHRAPHQ